MTFTIIKKGNNNFWHLFNNGAKEINLSDFQAVLDSVAQTFIIQALNGANIPQTAVGILDIIVIDETDASLEETFANVEALRTRLVELGYTPYLGAVADNITGLIEAGTNVTITGDGTTGNPYVISSSGGGGGAVTSVNSDTGAVIVDLQSATDEGNTITDGTDTNTVSASGVNINNGAGAITYLVNGEFGMTDGVNTNTMGASAVAFSDTSGNTGNFASGSLQLNSAIDEVLLTPIKIRVNDVDYPLPNGSSSQIATLLDIPSPITIDATPTDGSSNAVSSNGVFDALALKQDKSRILYASGASVTGVATESNIQTLFIPANTIQSEDAYTLIIPTFKSVTAATITYNVHHGTSSGARTTLIGTFLVAAATRSTSFQRFLSFVSGNLYSSSAFSTNANNPFQATTGNLSNQTLAFDRTIDNYITISANPSVTSEVIQVLDMTLIPRK